MEETLDDILDKALQKSWDNKKGVRLQHNGLRIFMWGKSKFGTWIAITLPGLTINIRW